MFEGDDRHYPESFHPEALWNMEEICGYLSIAHNKYYEIEPMFKTFKVGRRRVAFAANVIAYAHRIEAEQNPD